MNTVFSVLALIVVIVGGYWLYTNKPSPSMTNDAQAIEITTADASYFQGVIGYLARPAGDGIYPGIVMIHENRGLRPEIKTAAENLAREGYIVLAVDLYKGNVLETQDEARAYSSQFNQEEGTANMRAAVEYLRSQGASKVASWGWCFGGKQSVNLAISGEPLDATVVYYGGGMATTTEQLAPIKWPVMGVFGDQDQAIPVATVRTFESSLNTLGIENEIYMYPGVGHAFANPSNPNHAPAETADAWEKTVAFLNEHLK